MLLSFVSLLIGTPIPGPSISGPSISGPARPAVPVPDAHNAAAWREYLRPSHAESSYAEVAWMDRFSAAVIAGEREQRPVLFWAMNGHPLGCT
jgi:hypothetical protein